MAWLVLYVYAAWNILLLQYEKSFSSSSSCRVVVSSIVV